MQGSAGAAFHPALDVPQIELVIRALKDAGLAHIPSGVTYANMAWLVLATLALRGSLRAYLLWLGVVLFTVYNYVIYAFSVPFGPLFPLWVAVLGLCTYALIGGVVSADHDAIRAGYTASRPARVVAWVLIVAAGLFAVLWLSGDVPALLSGTTPPSVAAMGVPTNPVHVLDLAFFLPAAILTGAMVLQRVPLGYSLAPAFMVFLILSGVPILITPLVQHAIGQPAAWGVAVPIGTFTVALTILLAWVTGSVRGGTRSSSRDVQ